jgi:hypothetical protein
MKQLLLIAGLCLIITGCYTALYPPLNETDYGYRAGDSVMTVPDSLDGRNITIINQNQIIFDRYYQDPFYERGGFFGGYGCWDPYFYNPRATITIATGVTGRVLPTSQLPPANG